MNTGKGLSAPALKEEVRLALRGIYMKATGGEEPGFEHRLNFGNRCYVFVFRWGHYKDPNENVKSRINARSSSGARSRIFTGVEPAIDVL